MLPVPLNSSKITSSILEPVSVSAVAIIVSEPPFSIFRAAPKKRLGLCNALASTPPLNILPEAGSKMDEVIFEEFKGTGNMELQLDRKISNRRIFPAIDLTSSSTRRDDLLLSENVVQRMWVLRKYLADMNPVEAMEFINDRIKQSKNNEEFLVSMNG